MKKITIFSLSIFILILSGCGLWTNRFENPAENQMNTISETFTLEENNTSNKERTAATTSGEVIPEAAAIDTANLEKAINKYEEENEALKKTIKALESSEISHQDILKRAAEKQITFKSCGQFRNYQNVEWYGNLADLLSLQRFPLFGSNEPILISLANISSACLSDNGQIFIFIIPGDAGFNILRYDLKHQSLEMATLLNSFTRLGIPEQFGKRKDNVIQLKGIGVENGCRKEMNYEYNFARNELKVTKACDKCSNIELKCQEF